MIQIDETGTMADLTLESIAQNKAHQYADKVAVFEGEYQRAKASYREGFLAGIAYRLGGFDDNLGS